MEELEENSARVTRGLQVEDSGEPHGRGRVVKGLQRCGSPS